MSKYLNLDIGCSNLLKLALTLKGKKTHVSLKNKLIMLLEIEKNLL